MLSTDALVAGLDIHKKTVVVVILQKGQPDQDHATGTFGTTPFGLKELVGFLRQQFISNARRISSLTLCTFLTTRYFQTTMVWTVCAAPMHSSLIATSMPET